MKHIGVNMNNKPIRERVARENNSFSLSLRDRLLNIISQLLFSIIFIGKNEFFAKDVVDISILIMSS